MNGRLPKNITDMLDNPDCPNYAIADAIEELGVGTVASVYIVFGERGEYSDHRIWDVAAFLDQKKAEELRDRLNAVAREWREGYENDYYYEHEETASRKLKELGDPNTSVYFDSMADRPRPYGVMELPLRHSLPKEST